MTLSPREFDCLRLAAAGMTSKKIARRLGIAPGTVRKHWEMARFKLDATTMAHAVAKGFKRGLIW